MKAFSQRRRKVNLYQLVVWPEDAGYLKYIGWSNPIQSNPLNMLITERFTNCFEIGQNCFQIDTGCNVIFWLISLGGQLWKLFLRKQSVWLCCKRLINLAFIPNFDLSQKVTVTKLVWYPFIELIQGNWEAYIYEPGQICWSRHSQLLSKGLIDVVLALMANSNLQQ